MIQYEKSDPQRAAELYKTAADLGDGNGMLNYGAALFKGRGVEKNVQHEAQYYKMEADKGIANVMYNYAALLFSGNVVTDNVIEAIMQLERAVEKKHGHSKMMLADILLNGKNGASTDVPRTTRLFEEMAGKELDALRSLQRIYAKNTEKLIHYYQIGARMGDAISATAYGASLYRGTGVKQNTRDGLLVLNKAAELGSKQAAMHL